MKMQERAVTYALRRSKPDIIVDILRVAKEGAKKTHIMYRCNLSHTQLQAYLRLLLGMGFLLAHSEKESSKSDRLKTTAKGIKFLDAYSTLKALMT